MRLASQQGSKDCGKLVACLALYNTVFHVGLAAYPASYCRLLTLARRKPVLKDNTLAIRLPADAY